MTSTTSTPIVIRPARNDEYLDVAHLGYAAFSANPMFQLLTCKVDPSTWLEFSAEEFKQAAQGEFSSLLVAQHAETGEIVGNAFVHRYTKEHRPELPRCQFPEGWNEEEAKPIYQHGLEFQEGFLLKYGDYICMSPFAAVSVLFIA